MEYRGTVQGGVVVVEAGAILPEGQMVDVTPVPSAVDGDLPAAGLWRDRTDLGETAEVARELRRATNDRGR
jgi:hypothetical protein